MSTTASNRVLSALPPADPDPLAAAFYADSTGSEWRDPESLPVGMPPVDAFAPELLPAALRRWIVDIAERMQCPMDFVAVGAVVGMGAVAGRQVGIRPKRHDDWTVVPNLWGGIIGPPSMLKTPALGETMQPIDALEARARAEHEAAERDHRAGLMVAEAQAKQAKDLVLKAVKSGDATLAHANALEVADEIAPPTRRRYRTSDATVEKLGELLRDNSRGILVFRDELIGFLKSLEKEGREGSRSFFLESWNGTGSYTFDRIGRGTVEIEAACVSILGGIQPGPLGDYLRDAIKGGSGDDGLLQRFQLTVWPDPPATWRNVDRQPDRNARRAAHAVFERFDGFGGSDLGAFQENGDPLPWLRFDDAAQDLFDEWRTELERRLRNDDLPPVLEAHLAKYRSLAPSLALLFHLADNPNGGPVGKPSLLQALAWCEYLETHARRIFAPALAPDLFAASELDRRLLSLPDPFTARDIYQKGWRGLDREGTSAAVRMLEDYGRIRGEMTDGAGRPTVLYRVNPALREVRQ